MVSAINIEFEYLLEGFSKPIWLKAVATRQKDEIHFFISDIRGRSGRAVLPDFDIKKLEAIWVHADSEKATYLSKAAGDAIDAILSAQLKPNEGGAYHICN